MTMNQRVVPSFGVAVVVCLILFGCSSTQDASSGLEGEGGTHEVRFGDPPANMVVTELEDDLIAMMLGSDESTWHVQEHEDFCWAACMQTLLRLHGATQVPTQQDLWEENVANPLFESDREAATFAEIRHTLAPGYREKMAGYVVLDALDTTSLTDLVRELASGQAVIVGLRDDREDDMGHAYVAYGLKYRESEDKGVSFMQGVKAIGNAAESFTNTLTGKSGKEEKVDLSNKHTAVAVYLFDPEKPKFGGGLKEKSIEEISGTLDFAISMESADRFLSEQLAWLMEFDDGPGLYVRNPFDHNGKPTSKNTIQVSAD